MVLEHKNDEDLNALINTTEEKIQKVTNVVSIGVSDSMVWI